MTRSAITQQLRDLDGLHGKLHIVIVRVYFTLFSGNATYIS